MVSEIIPIYLGSFSSPIYHNTTRGPVALYTKQPLPGCQAKKGMPQAPSLEKKRLAILGDDDWTLGKIAAQNKKKAKPLKFDNPNVGVFFFVDGHLRDDFFGWFPV